MLEGGVWRTVAGRRIFIKNGQSLTDAMKNSGKFQKDNLQKKLKNQLKKEDEEIQEIEEDIESFKKGKSDIYEDMKTEQFKKILKHLGIKPPNVLNKIERIGYDGTFTTIGRVSIRELKTFGEVLRKVIES